MSDDRAASPEADQVPPGETSGVVTLRAPLAWIDWWVKGRIEGEKEPPGRPSFMA